MLFILGKNSVIVNLVK